MKRIGAFVLVAAMFISGLSVAASLFPRFDYSRQDREHFAGGPCRQHWLGTDALGRDQFARLLYGTGVSLLLAPAGAAISLSLALIFGALPGFAGGVAEKLAGMLIDLMLSVPWLFLLLIVRAAMPLNTSPSASVTVTFVMLGLLGWGVPARVLLARSSRLRESDFLLLARAAGVPVGRLLRRHLLPNLWPVLSAQFLLTVPAFILAEANLSILGLGVSEPLPSLGSLLREMESALTLRSDIGAYAALATLLVLVGSLQLAVRQNEVC
jgi:ABC-type dipeptide/oligopeptide/nickel transport system permease subunit